MKKHIQIVIVFILLSGKIFSQAAQPVQPDTSWKKGGFVSLTFSQLNLSQWAPGGVSSMALSATTNLFANYIKDKTDWENTLNLAYSFVKAGDDKARKSDDRIEFNTNYGHKFANKWLYNALLNFKSQFANGYILPDDSTPVSHFMAPAYLTVSIGVTYKPVDYFEVFISPAAGKFTFVNDNTLSEAGAYGVSPGKKLRSEFGAYMSLKFKKDIIENVTLITKLELFNNYTDADKANAKKVDVNWESALNLKVNKYITASITTQLVYDANIIERTQFKEALGIGFGYKF